MPSKRKKSIQEVAISEFKAKCLSLLDEISKTRLHSESLGAAKR